MHFSLSLLFLYILKINDYLFCFFLERHIYYGASESTAVLDDSSSCVSRK